MKKIFIFLIVSLISVFSFAKCDFFQVANDCNGNSTTVIAKNDTTSLDIHANWNQGNISYNFQSGSEKLDMLVYANDMTRLYTEITYKNKSALIYYDFNLGQMTTDDEAAFQALIQSINRNFLASCQLLLADMPQTTANLNLLYDIAYALVNHSATSPFDMWKYLAYSICYYSTLGDADCCHCLWIAEKTKSECVASGDCKK